MQRQRSDLVNEIVDAVFFELYKDECQALRNFRARENELMFLSWLAIICGRITNRHIHKLFKIVLYGDDEEELKDCLNGLNGEMRWEIYEAVIVALRNSTKRKKAHLERDINIFQMYIWGDFSGPMMVSSHPCLRKLGTRVVEMVVSRIRGNLRSQKIFFE
ncbi:MAG: hypothetical protein ACRENG_18640 [bacterium]